MSKIIINSIMENPSLCDGYGYRVVLFLQGCDIRCKGCQNETTWDINKGISFDTKDLAKLLREKCLNKKLTISGGEPLLQTTAVIDLCKELVDFNLCLYTGHQLNDVPQELLGYLKYIKVGPFIEEQKTSLKPFVGSKNQEFIEVNKNEAK